MRRNRTLRLYFLVMLFLEAFRRSWGEHDLFNQVLFVIESLFFAFVAYEIVSDRWHQRKLRRRARRVHQFFVEGQAIKDAVPKRGVDGEAEAVAAWIKRLDSWMDDTNARLLKYSPQASAAFIQSHPIDHKFVPHIAAMPNRQLEYLTLYERLDNLRTIMERSEVYLDK